MTILQDVFFELSDRIEKQFPVADWRIGDIPLWPVLRISLPHAVAAREYGSSPADQSILLRLTDRVARAATYAGTPLTNAWRRRGSPAPPLVRADALFLGTGATYDKLDGLWQDRFCEPLMRTLDGANRTSLLMEDGDIRVPQVRSFHAVNTLDRWTRLGVLFGGLGTRLPVKMEGHGDMLAFLRRESLPIHYFDESISRYHAALITVLAHRFGQILNLVQPRKVFIVRYYNEMGYALSLACRRRGILSVELQHGGQGGHHEAYNGFFALPSKGYSTLPAIFWNWMREDADAINSWAQRLAQPWHRALFGGHPQLLPWFDSSNPNTQAFDARITAMQAGIPGDRDILVALQDLPEFAPVWDALAETITQSPSTWRWWLRRHPSPLYSKGIATRRILALNQPNVETEAASTMPLPALLRHMNVMLCHSSGTAVEASAFSVPSIFLSENARGLFSGLLRSGKAEIITDMATLVARLSQESSRPQADTLAYPAVADTLAQLDALVDDYRQLCAAGQD
jgi:hypothetical protein